jgi:hypothetical protein
MWADEVLNNFVIYAYSPDGDSFAIIDLLTGEIYRRMDDFKDIQSVISNEQGSLVFISTFNQGSNSGSIYKINTATWDYEIIHEKAAHLLENRKGGIFFITKRTGSSPSERIFGKVNHVTGEVTEIASIDVRWMAYKDDNAIEIHPYKTWLYAVDGNNRFYRFDYTTSTTDYMFQGLPFITNFTLSADGEILYRIGSVLDLNREEIVGTFSVPLSAGLGSITPRKDNTGAYITDPGMYYDRPPYSQRKVYMYGLEKDSVIDSIDIGSLTDQIYLTPQDRYAVVNDWKFSYFIIDLEERKVIKKQQYVENYVSIQGFYLASKPPSLK